MITSIDELYLPLRKKIVALSKNCDFMTKKYQIRPTTSYCTARGSKVIDLDIKVMTPEELVGLDLINDYLRSILLSGFNQICEEAEGKSPLQCDENLAYRCSSSLLEKIDVDKKVLIVGIKEIIIDKISSARDVRAIDLSSNFVWEEHSGVMVEHGAHLNDALIWSDIVLVTEETIFNEKVIPIINNEKKVIFLGEKFKYTARELKLNHYCIAS